MVGFLHAKYPPRRGKDGRFKCSAAGCWASRKSKTAKKNARTLTTKSGAKKSSKKSSKKKREHAALAPGHYGPLAPGQGRQIGPVQPRTVHKKSSLKGMSSAAPKAKKRARKK
jgi:hypothetical protein